MQARYIFAGLVAPALLVAFFAVGIARGDARLLGYGGNIMALFVGWHYVKQGYGMLMVDAVLKRNFFKDPEKKVFLLNSYARLDFRLAQRQRRDQQAAAVGTGILYVRVPGADRAGPPALAALAGGLRMLWVLYHALARERRPAVERRARLFRQPLSLAPLRAGSIRSGCSSCRRFTRCNT